MRLKSLVIIFFCLLTLDVYATDNSQLGSPHHFKNYRELFSFIAIENELVDDNPEILLKFSADSRTDYQRWPGNEKRFIALITPNYFEPFTYNNQKILTNRIRGAQNNGLIYVVSLGEEGVDLIDNVK